MGHKALPPTRAGLFFGEIRLFEHVLALGDANTPRYPTLVYILLLFYFNFKLTFNNYKLLVLRHVGLDFMCKSECEFI